MKGSELTQEEVGEVQEDREGLPEEGRSTGQWQWS